MLINPYRFGGGGGGGTDPQFANVLAGLHLDGANGSSTFTDIKGNTWTRADSGTVIDTSASKFGGASLNVTQYISTPNASFANFGTGDFTLDGWINFSNVAGFQTMYSRGYVAGGGLVIQTGSGNGAFIVYMGGGVVCSEASGVTAGAWHYYKVGRNGTTVTIERDGVQTASGTSSVNLNDTSQIELFGATGGSGTTPIIGHADDWRITNAWRSSSAVPTSAFPNS
jgi:hypothetical protein